MPSWANYGNASNTGANARDQYLEMMRNQHVQTYLPAAQRAWQQYQGQGYGPHLGMSDWYKNWSQQNYSGLGSDVLGRIYGLLSGEKGAL